MPRPRWRGFSFALHLLRVQGFYFSMLQCSPIQAFTARFAPSMQLCRPRRKTAHRALQVLFLRFTTLYRRKYQTYTIGYNTACTTLEHITAPQHLQHIPDTSATPGRCTGQHRPPIIIRYIRVQGCACRRFMPDSAADRRPYQPIRVIPAAGGAEPLTATAVSLFGLSPDSQ